MLESIYLDEKWYDLQQEKEDGVYDEFRLNSENGDVIYRYIKRRAGKYKGIEYFDIVTTRGFGGPIFLNVANESELAKEFEEEFQAYCEKQKIIAEYIKFDPWLRNDIPLHKYYNIYFHGNTYCNDLTDDFYHRQYHTNARARVKQAINNNVEIIFDTKGERIEEFIELYKYTEKLYNVSNFYKMDKNFIEKYFAQLKDKCVIGLALSGSVVTNGALILLGKDIAHYHMLGNNPQYRNLQGNSLLMYKSACYAKEVGKKLFDMGGSALDSTVEEFKKKFARENNKYPYYVGTKIRNDVVYDFFTIKNEKQNSKYFPKYRGIK